MNSKTQDDPLLLIRQDVNPEAGKLVIPNGTTIPIRSGREYIFDSIDIKQGGILKITGSKKEWTKIVIINECKIEGKIVCRNFETKEQPNETIEEIYNGNVLKHTYSNDKMGGRGGHGASRSSYPRGAGAGPYNYFGGGGGGGIGMEGCRNCHVAPGGGAGGRNPGIGGQVSNHHDGGDGGWGGLKGAIDGGLLYLECRGDLSGGGGTIDVRGSKGGAGEDGTYAGCGAGGGGGGAPGGNGGKVIFRLLGDIIPPTVMINPGKGGEGGSGKAGSTDWSPPIEQSGSGSAGQEGNEGEVEFVL